MKQKTIHFLKKVYQVAKFFFGDLFMGICLLILFLLNMDNGLSINGPNPDPHPIQSFFTMAIPMIIFFIIIGIILELLKKIFKKHNNIPFTPLGYPPNMNQ